MLKRMYKLVCGIIWAFLHFGPFVYTVKKKLIKGLYFVLQTAIFLQEWSLNCRINCSLEWHPAMLSKLKGMPGLCQAGDSHICVLFQGYLHFLSSQFDWPCSILVCHKRGSGYQRTSQVFPDIDLLSRSSTIAWFLPLHVKGLSFTLHSLNYNI